MLLAGSRQEALTAWEEVQRDLPPEWLPLAEEHIRSNWHRRPALLRNKAARDAQEIYDRRLAGKRKKK